jgi:predicted GNAT family N-acyltransferase
MDQIFTEADWKVMRFKGVENCPIDEVRELRRLCWPAIYGAGYSLEDGFDEDAWHWTVSLANRVIAAARLTTHQHLLDVPDAHLCISLLPLALPVPIGYFSRLVVSPEARGNGLAGKLDTLRLGACRDFGVQSVACSWTPSSGIGRRQQLMEFGFNSSDGHTLQPDGVFGESAVYWRLLANQSGPGGRYVPESPE